MIYSKLSHYKLTRVAELSQGRKEYSDTPSIPKAKEPMASPFFLHKNVHEKVLFGKFPEPQRSKRFSIEVKSSQIRYFKYRVLDISLFTSAFVLSFLRKNFRRTDKYLIKFGLLTPWDFGVNKFILKNRNAALLLKLMKRIKYLKRLNLSLKRNEYISEIFLTRIIKVLKIRFKIEDLTLNLEQVINMKNKALKELEAYLKSSNLISLNLTLKDCYKGTSNAVLKINYNILIKAIKFIHTLKTLTLDFTNGRIHAKNELFEDLISVLEKTSNLKYLNLDFTLTEMYSYVIQKLANSKIIYSSNIKSLRLSLSDYFKFDDGDIEPLTVWLKKFKNLEYLDLSFRGISKLNEVIIIRLLNIIKEFTNLKSLALNFWGLKKITNQSTIYFNGILTSLNPNSVNYT